MAACFCCGSLTHKGAACSEAHCRGCQLWGHGVASCPQLWVLRQAKSEQQRVVSNSREDVHRLT
jgi:hypothetical protein